MIDQELVKQFKSSPVCQMSLSSKELFHSNLIAFLIEQNNEFANFILEDESNTECNVFREKMNIDITVERNGKKYLIENKVKSLPDADQLIKYMEKAKKSKAEDHVFILITLAEPQFKGIKFEYPLKVKTYKEINVFLRNHSFQNDYLDLIVKDYTQLLDILEQLKDASVIKEDDKTLDFSQKDENILKRVRLFDVAQKIRYSSFLEKFKREFTEAFSLLESCNSTITKSLGLVEFNMCLLRNKNIFIGIQIQGKQYRRFILSVNKDKDVLDEMHAIMENKPLHDWFNKNAIKEKDFNRFGEIFQYKYEKVDNKSVKEILYMLNEDLLWLNEIKSKI